MLSSFTVTLRDGINVMCWISCHPSIMAVFWMRSLATSLWCWFCPLGLQQPIKAQRKRYSTTSQFCGHFYFRVKSSFPVLFTWIIALIWVSHCADFTESSFQNKAVDVVKKWWRENVNELLWFELVRTSPLPPPPKSYSLDWVTWCVFFGLGW